MSSPLAYDPQPPRPPWGVRVDPHKKPSMAQPIKVTPLPHGVCVPLDKLPGCRAEAMVQPGDQVLTGQLIGRFGQTPMHGICAPVAGQVRAISPQPVPTSPGRDALCVLIDADGTDRWSPECQPPESPASLPRERLHELIAGAGIVGLGGALFPTAEKLRTSDPVDLLILNGAECEPYITCDEMLMRERPEHIIHGAAIMLRALGGGQAVIAIESDMPEARVALKSALDAANEPAIGVAVVTAKYPAGGERQLVELLTGREVPLGGLPGDVGIVCQNVATAAAVSDLFRGGRPLISRIVTLTGAGIARPVNLEARLGTPLKELIASAGGYTQDNCRLYMGGPMMGIALDSDELPVTEATNCIIVSTPEEFAVPRPEFPCIRCGECSRVCPARLMPQDLLTACLGDQEERLAALHIDACIECGCCDYVCPSQIALTPRFVTAKARQKQLRLERTRAAAARRRSDAHAARMSRRAGEFADGPAPEAGDQALQDLLARIGQQEPDDA